MKKKFKIKYNEKEIHSKKENPSVKDIRINLNCTFFNLISFDYVFWQIFRKNILNHFIKAYLFVLPIYINIIIFRRKISNIRTQHIYPNFFRVIRGRTPKPDIRNISAENLREIRPNKIVSPAPFMNIHNKNHVHEHLCALCRAEISKRLPLRYVTNGRLPYHEKNAY